MLSVVEVDACAACCTPPAKPGEAAMPSRCRDDQQVGMRALVHLQSSLLCTAHP
jgi:hypothetical protein